MHTAEGELFRNALIYASELCDLRVTGVHERDLYELATGVLKISRDPLRQWVTELGQPIAPPPRLGSGPEKRRSRRLADATI